MSAALQGDSQEIVVMTRLYDAAVRQLVLKFEILNDEFKVLYARNPIHHIEGRVKSLPSIAAKLLKKGQPLTIEAAKRNVNDIAGVRVVCGYIDDVYRVADMMTRQAVIAEIQIRTIAMDFWASLEHDVRYKVDKTRLPAGINEEMLACADRIAEIDRKMQDMYRRIKAAEGK